MLGFGASDKYHLLLTGEQADLLFSPSAGIGLSLLRVAIGPNGNYIGTPANARLAAARGAKVWAVPWSPPGEWKDNGRTENGGHLLAAHYSDWAARLAGFRDTLQRSTGVTLYALSPQNEVNYAATWDSCIYTPEELRSFVKVLGPLIARESPRPLLVAPEAASWGPLWDYTRAVLADPVAASYVNAFSAHQYSGVTPPQTTARPLWQTEYSTFDAPTASIDNGISVAHQIHDALVVGNASAWHYWWLIGRSGDNQGLLNQGGALTKRLFTVGNFSKFVRPGNVRLGTSADPAGVETSAFKDGCTNAFAVVVINTNSSDVRFGLAFNGATADTLTPWVTSASLDLRAGTPITAVGGRFATTLRARSVTTFVGTAH